ncbi:MAG: heavy metal-binding domain-containing protein [Candidatus Thermoplasmatota archaeon]|jgi:uncharacterized protein YbjQ (UPF0145 family)|nr:heavy metal-binding domain-containing protein [Candidatus Thermoplasmatota archaeon]
MAEEKSSAATVNQFAPPSDFIVVTTPYVPGYRVTKVIGATFGLVVRSRGLGQNIGAFFRSWAGGEIKVYTNLLEKVRHQAIERLCNNAKNLGGNAVISVGFDTSEIGNATTEVLAFGTAVVIEKESGQSQNVSLT